MSDDTPTPAPDPQPEPEQPETSPVIHGEQGPELTVLPDQEDHTAPADELDRLAEPAEPRPNPYTGDDVRQDT